MSSRYDDDYGWPAYVSVAEKKAKAANQLDKLKKKGNFVKPVQIVGQKIAQSFWGKGWCNHIESFGDYVNRLPRGRSYVRHGAVCHLDIKNGQIKAKVSGSSLYTVTIDIQPIAQRKWAAIKKSCSGRIGSLLDLLRGKLDKGVMEVVTDRKNGLFPLAGEIKFSCSCPDWAYMCKHIAATLYGIGARLDEEPELLFVLRGVNHEELVDVKAVVADATSTKVGRKRISVGDLAGVFGVEMAEELQTVQTSKNEQVEKPVATEQGSVTGKTKVTPATKKSPKASTKTETSTSRKKVALDRARERAAEKETILRMATSLEAEKNKRPPFPEPLTGTAIRAWRLRLGETQAVFGARLKVSAGNVSHWERKGSQTVGLFTSTLVAMRKVWQKK